MRPGHRLLQVAHRWLLAVVLAAGGTLPEAAGPAGRCWAQAAGEAQVANAESSLNAARQLVRQLGDPSLQRRDEASRQLVELANEAVIKAAEEGLRSADAEVRRRCRVILDRVHTLIHQRQLAEFIQHPERDVQLPGWERFRKLVGEDAVARALFADMQSAEPELLRLAEQPSRALPALLEDRMRELHPPNFGMEQPVSVDSVAALMFVACHDDIRPTADTVHRLQQVAFQQVFRYAVQTGPRKDALRKLVDAWIRATLDEGELYTHVRLALLLQLEAGVQAAWKLLEQQGLPPDAQLLAVLTVGRFGTAADIPKLERHLENTATVLQQPRPQGVVRTQVRDVVLAVLLHLAGENLADYGLGHLAASSDTLYDPSSIYFESDEARAAALEKWRSRQNRADRE